MGLILSIDVGTTNIKAALVDENGRLRGITERVKLRANGDGQVHDEDSGLDFPTDTLVSMNCWGFGPAFMDYLEGDFVGFLQQVKAGEADLAKGEFYLPAAVDRWRELPDSGAVTVKPSEETWLGVTYPEDKEAVVRGIAEAHGGQVSYERRDGRSAFTITLPRKC